MKARIFRAGSAVALTAAAALAVTGCAGADPTAAARVNGSVIEESSLTSIVDDLNAERQGPPIGASNVLQYMILNEVAATSPNVHLPAVSADEARSVIQQDPATAGGVGFGVADPSPAFVEFVQGNLALDKAAQAQELDRDKLTTLVQDADIQVNPKYGTGFDAQQGIVHDRPNWLVADEANAGSLLPPGEAPAPTGPPETLPGPAPTP